MKNENVFEEKAEKILGYLRSDVRYNQKFLPRPFMVEFTGTPSAGKTTTITELDKFFRRIGFRVWRPQEGAEVIRHIDRTTPLYNVRTAMYAVTLLIDEGVGHKYDLVIFDRCVFDSYCWLEYWHEKGKLTKGEKQAYQKFFLSDLWTQNLDAAYLTVCEPEEAMKRELKIALSKKLGETTNPATIKTLVERYRRAYRELKDRYPQLFLIDTTDLTEKKMVEQIAMQTLEIFEKKTAAS